MNVEGDYQSNGYATLRGLVPPEVADVFLRRLKRDMESARIPMQQFAQTSEILSKNAVEIYGYQYRPMIQFLWGMTPAIREATGRDLLPTYNYFRLYQRGDICRVHSDRASCEHSLSLTLAYSDGEPWALNIGTERIDDTQPIEDGFGDKPFASIAMQPGDAVLYKGYDLRHGRVDPNPNRWSAHMFLHWVDRDGPQKHHAFDQREPMDGALDFQFE